MEELNKLIEEARAYAKDKDFFDEYMGHENPQVVESFLQDAISQLREGKASSLEELYPNEIKAMFGLEVAREEKTPRELSMEEMRDAAKNGQRGNFSLEEAVQAMLKYKERGEHVTYRFNGYELDSDNITKYEAVKKGYDKFLRDRSTEEKTPRELSMEEMRDAAKNGQRGNFTLEEAVQAMLKYKERGEHVTYRFNGYELDSDNITTYAAVEKGYNNFLRESSTRELSSEEPGYQVTTKDLAVATKENVGTRIIRKVKEIFNKIRNHDNDIGGR